MPNQDHDPDAELPSFQKEASREDVEQMNPAAFSGPAVSATRCLVTVLENGVRISFLEQSPDLKNTQYRAAVLLAHRQAIALKNALERMLGPIEESLVALESSLKTSEKSNGDEG